MGANYDADSDSEYYVASVTDFSSIFIPNNPEYLTLLCEFVVNEGASSIQLKDEQALYHLLLQLYLSDTIQDINSNAQSDSAKYSTQQQQQVKHSKQRKALELL